jgi:hypothetical protein
MTHARKYFIIAFIISIVSFISFLPSILKNDVLFQIDELYWIQTGRILPYIYNKKFQDPYWHEHFGYTNFNGAKWIYAVGLLFTGKNNFELIAYPPHYEKWNPYDGITFPQTDPIYSMLLRGRIISALVTSLAISLMFVFSCVIFEGKMIPALAASVLLRFHPTIPPIATHALADSMMLAFELINFTLLAVIMKKPIMKTQNMIMYLGISLGYSIGIKINAYMFFFIATAHLIFRAIIQKIRTIEFVKTIGILFCSTCIAYIFIHPNFFFYPQYAPMQMIKDRIDITSYHIRYYSAIDPSHVLNTLPQRLLSMTHHVFTPLYLIVFPIGLILLIKKRSKLFIMQIINMLCIAIFFMSYVVFDDPRYFIPLVPFVCLISASSIMELL